MVIKRGGGEFPGGSVVRTALPLKGARVWSLVGELRQGTPHGVAKNKKGRRYWQRWVLWSAHAGQMSCDLCRDTPWSGSLWRRMLRNKCQGAQWPAQTSEALLGRLGQPGPAQLLSSRSLLQPNNSCYVKENPYPKSKEVPLNKSRYVEPTWIKQWEGRSPELGSPDLVWLLLLLASHEDKHIDRVNSEKLLAWEVLSIPQHCLAGAFLLVQMPEHCWQGGRPPCSEPHGPSSECAFKTDSELCPAR